MSRASIKVILTPSGTVAVPVVGDLMRGRGADANLAHYRINQVTVLRTAGTPARRYRLTCSMVPGRPARGAVVHPWKLFRLEPKPRSRAAEEPLTSPLLARMGIRDRDMLERIRAKTPVLFALGLMEPMQRHKDEAREEELARVARVGVDRGVVNRSDHGHSARQDVEVDQDARDVGSPKVRISRARRADPMHTLLKHRSITLRQFAAMEALRDDVEDSMPSLAGASQSEVHAAPWDRVSVSDHQIAACAAVRAAVALVIPADRWVLTWMVGGGTIGGFEAFARVNRRTALTSLRNGLDAMAGFFLGGK
jgi:hypothetical protein